MSHTVNPNDAQHGRNLQFIKSNIPMLHISNHSHYIAKNFSELNDPLKQAISSITIDRNKVLLPVKYLV